MSCYWLLADIHWCTEAILALHMSLLALSRAAECRHRGVKRNRLSSAHHQIIGRLLGLRTCLRLNAFQYPGNGILGGRDQEWKNARASFAPGQRLIWSCTVPRNWPPFGWRLRSSEIPETGWWRMQSHANPSPRLDSLLTGKRTGKLAEIQA